MKHLAIAAAALTGAVWLLAFWLPDAIAESQVTTTVIARGEIREYGYGQIRFNGKGPEAWRWTLVQLERKFNTDLAAERAENRRLRASLRRKWAPQALSMARVACAAYAHHGGCDPHLIYRQIDCETGGTFDPWAKNRTSTASGWGQFLDTTWAGTPFAGFSRFDPIASTLAIAKAHADGNGESPRGPWMASARCWSR